MLFQCFIFALSIAATLSGEKYYSQCGQDAFVHRKYFANKTGGTFVDIGANDGITINNTYFFEQTLGWTGLCIEPIPETFALLEKNRSCACVRGCISSKTQKNSLFLRLLGPLEGLSGLLKEYDPKHLLRIERELREFGGSAEVIHVDEYNFNDLLEAYGIKEIDFLSIDTEGGELKILQSIDFDRFTIDVIAVENNYRDPLFIPFMRSKGYHYVTSLEQDQIFKRRKNVKQNK